MNSSVMQGILDALNGDALILQYLHGARVFRGWINQDTIIPCITVIENNENSKPRVGYFNSGHRDNTPGIQIDIWISKSQEGFPSTNDDLDVIAQRIDEFMFHTGVTNTHLWEKVSTSEQFEPDTGLFHKALRYNFRYNLHD